MARRIRFFSSQIEKETQKIEMRPLWDSAPMITVGPRVQYTIDELDVKLSEHEKRLNHMNESYSSLSERLRELIEARHVLRETAVFFDKVRNFWVMCYLTDGMRRRRRSNMIFASRLKRILLRCSNMMTARTSIHPPPSRWTLSMSTISHQFTPIKS